MTHLFYLFVAHKKEKMGGPPIELTGVWLSVVTARSGCRFFSCCAASVSVWLRRVRLPRPLSCLFRRRIENWTGKLMRAGDDLERCLITCSIACPILHLKFFPTKTKMSRPVRRIGNLGYPFWSMVIGGSRWRPFRMISTSYHPAEQNDQSSAPCVDFQNAKDWKVRSSF